MISPPLFPIVPMQLRGAWEFRAIEPGRTQVEGFEALAREIPYKGGRTLGLRVSDGTTAVAHLSDHAPQFLGLGDDGVGEYHAAALELARDVDLLIHDAQHTVEELAARGCFGHAAGEYALGLAERSRARCLALFHHDPGRNDQQVEAIAASLKAPEVEVVMAREDLVVQLPARSRVEPIVKSSSRWTEGSTACHRRCRAHRLRAPVDLRRRERAGPPDGAADVDPHSFSHSVQPDGRVLASY